MLSQNKSKIKLLQLVLLIAISTQAYAQVQIKSVNAGISIGSVNGNSLPFTAFGGKISSDFNLWFSDEVSFQFGFEHSRKIEYYLLADFISSDQGKNGIFASWPTEAKLQVYKFFVLRTGQQIDIHRMLAIKLSAFRYQA